MTLLPEGTILGELHLVEVFEYYDGPRLFSCRSNSERIYLALSVDEDASTHSWLYLAISSERLTYVRSGAIPLRQAYTDAEDGNVLLVRLPREEGAPQLELLEAGAIPTSMLPAPEVHLDLVTPTLPALTDDRVRDVAVQRRRDTVVLGFEFPGAMRTEAPAEFLGSVLTSFQDLVTAIVQATRGEATSRGQVQRDVLEESQVAVTGFLAASFNVELSAVQLANLFDESVPGQAFEQFIRLLKSGSGENLHELLVQLQARAASRYRAFLEELISEPVDLKVIWGSPRRDRGESIQLSRSELLAISSAVGRMDPEEVRTFEVTGPLIAVHSRRLTFEIQDRGTRERFSGRIAPEALEQASHATIQEIYTATIQEVVEVSPYTGEEKITRRLLGLTAYRRDG